LEGLDAINMELLSTATSQDERQRASAVAVLPVGSFEQHGRILPLITDTAIASIIAQDAASAYDLFLLPPLTISCSHEHASFPGTVSIKSSTLHALIDDIAMSLERSGVLKMVLVNGHGGNYVLSNIVQEANLAGPRMSLFPSRADVDRARSAAGMRTTAHEDMHGGEWETSILLHARPDLVSGDHESADHIANERPHLLIHGVAGYTTNGIIGRPSLATASKGKAAIHSLTESFADHLRALGAAPTR
jgi:creatinine amidohydrolase